MLSREKLSPGNIVANAKSATTEKVKDMASNAADSARDMAATAADTAEEWWEASGGNTVVDRLRNNPIPALMTGVGVAWLLMSNGERYRGNGDRYRPYLRQVTAQLSYRTASDRTTDWSTETGEGRRMASPNGRSAMRNGVRQIETMVRQYPLAVGAAAVLIGASLGMVVPETERENELMGEARDTALERAQEVATGTCRSRQGSCGDGANPGRSRQLSKGASWTGGPRVRPAVALAVPIPPVALPHGRTHHPQLSFMRSGDHLARIVICASKISAAFLRGFIVESDEADDLWPVRNVQQRNRRPGPRVLPGRR